MQLLDYKFEGNCIGLEYDAARDGTGTLSTPIFVDGATNLIFGRCIRTSDFVAAGLPAFQFQTDTASGNVSKSNVFNPVTMDQVVILNTGNQGYSDDSYNLELVINDVNPNFGSFICLFGEITDYRF